MAEQLGAFFGILSIPLLLLGLIGLVQWLRTGDRRAAQRAMRAWWAIGAALALLLLSLVARFVQNFS
ncbi:MAG: hypothetical protein U0350_08670 [Caldilineaceae bacterium]